MDRIVVLRVEAYAFDGRDGEKVHVRNVMWTDAIATQDQRERGFQVITSRVDESVLAQLQAVPGVYDAVLRMRQRGRNSELAIAALGMVRPLDLSGQVMDAPTAAANGKAAVEVAGR
jgi:hypothetical protein